MTQWKLVPVEPTREMIEAAFGAINYTMPEPSEDAGRVYSAMLSAATSPDWEEVERVARALCIDAGIDPDAETVMTIPDPNGGSQELGECAEWETMESAARAAIAAMRPTNQPATKD